MRTVGKVFKTKNGRKGENGRNGTPEVPVSEVNEQVVAEERKSEESEK